MGRPDFRAPPPLTYGPILISTKWTQQAARQVGNSLKNISDIHHSTNDSIFKKKKKKNQ